MIVWFHNLKNFFQLIPDRKVRCPHCKAVEDMAVYWDYQKCGECGGYIYDNRI
jgi:ribosomal protein S27AE